MVQVKVHLISFYFFDELFKLQFIEEDCVFEKLYELNLRNRENILWKSKPSPKQRFAVHQPKSLSDHNQFR